MNGRRSRLARKAAKVYADERERECAEALGKARADRDKQLYEAARAFTKAVRVAQDQRGIARKEAEDAYLEKRATILKAFAAEEAA